MQHSEIRLQPSLKVTTFNAAGKPNGWLMELYKDGNKTTAYLTAVLPGSFKGYHLHRVRAARYVAVKGTMKIITFQREGEKWVKSENILSADNPQRMFIPKDVATGLENIGTEEAWLINYPDPAYDPDLKNEQVEYTLQELEQGIIK